MCTSDEWHTPGCTCVFSWSCGEWHSAWCVASVATSVLSLRVASGDTWLYRCLSVCVWRVVQCVWQVALVVVLVIVLVCVWRVVQTWLYSGKRGRPYCTWRHAPHDMPHRTVARAHRTVASGAPPPHRAVAREADLIVFGEVIPGSTTLQKFRNRPAPYGKEPAPPPSPLCKEPDPPQSRLLRHPSAACISYRPT